MVVDLSKTALIRIHLAGHQRDEAAAEALAEGGVQFYRLILVASNRLRKQPRSSAWSPRCSRAA